MLLYYGKAFMNVEFSGRLIVGLESHAVKQWNK